MKKFLVGTALLVLALSPLHLALALPLEIAPPRGATGTNNAPVITPTATSPTRAAAAAATPPDRTAGEWLYDNTIGAVTGWLSEVSLDLIWWLMSAFAYMFYMIAEFLMWLGTTLFDNVLYFLVTNMGSFIQHEDARGVRIAWQAIRDLMNIGIIAGFIIVGISTILQTQQYSANRFLARLIIGALLVNFSYFFAGAVIDASNYIAVQAQRSQIMQEGCVKLDKSKHLGYLASGASSVVSWAVGTDDLCSVSGTFSKIIGLGTWGEIKDFISKNAEGKGNVNKTVFFVGMIGGFMHIIVGFIFFSAAVLLIGRFVVLILLLITSPVGVAGINIPYIDEYAKKWWGMLFSHAFFAPVFILLVAIGLRILADSKKIFDAQISGTGSYAAIASGNFESAVNVIPMFISFGIGIGFMYASLAIARSMSESGKEFVGSIYAGVQKNVGGLYGDIYQATAGGLMRMPSMAYDATIGQISRIPILGSLPLISPLIKGVGMRLRQDPGGKPFGASATNADAAKNMQEYTKSLESFGVLANAARHPIETAKKLGYVARDAWDNFVEKFFGVGSLADLMKRAANGEKIEGAARRKLERHVQSIKDEDFDKMSPDELAALSPYMSVKQYKRVMERSDFNEAQRERIQDARWKEVHAARDKGDYAEVARLLGNMDKTERKLLLVERDEYRNDKQMLAALDAKTYQDVIDDSDIYGSDADFKLADGTDMRDHRAKTVANTPSKISDTDAKRIKNGDIDQGTIDNMTPAQARRLYKNTKDVTLQKRLAQRFPELEGPGPSLADEDEDEDNAKKKKDKEKEDKKE